MKKYCLTWPLFLLAVLLLMTSASAAGETAIGRIEIENRAYSGVLFSCDVKLSGTQMQGCLFAVVCAESEQVKSVSDYPAAETVKVTLRNVAETDCVKILLVDAQYMPLANPAVLRMSANNTAAYEKFTKDLAVLKSFDGAAGEAASGSASPYALKRLLVSCDTLPDLSRYNGKVTTVSGPDNLYVLQFNNPAAAEECEQYLKSASSVRYVEPDAVMTANAEADTSYEPHSWGVFKSGIGEYAENLRQRGVQRPVIVAVVDSGVESDHPFLKNRLIPGYDYIEYDDIPQDENGHGTHVAGTIADCTPYMDVKIMPVRVLDAFASGSYLSIANGIRYAANHGANIINLSLGSTKHSQTIEDAVNDALSKNVTVVVAAGNKMGNVDHFCPAHMEDCITVAAVDSDLKRYELSNYGEVVDIAAPGVGINSSTLNGGYGEMSGTSMATPHVSAAVALLMSERGIGQTPFQISSLLRDATTDIGEPGKDVYFGAGFLNMRPFVLHSVYALLYADGELLFQKNNTPASNRELVKAYPVSASGETGGQYAAWYERRADIRKITFADTIRPTSSALWFYGCTNLTEIQGLENLDSSELTDMSQMFARCTSLQTLDLTALDTSKVETLNGMFFFCEKLTKLDLTGWNTENVTDTRDMFMACSTLGTVYTSGSFTMESVSESAGMFGGCASLIGGAGTQYDSTHTDKQYARIDGGVSAPGYFTDKNAPIPSTDIYAVLYADGELVFQNHDGVESGRTVTDVYKVYGRYPLGSQPWSGRRDNITAVTFADKIQPTSTAYWFDKCTNLKEIRNIKNLDTSSVAYMDYMFQNCTGLTELDVSNFNTGNVSNMSYMFSGCSGLITLDLSSFNTANVTNMSCMFVECSGLTVLDVSNFNTANITDMSGMFNYCSGLTALDLSRFDTANVTDMFLMFYDCSKLTVLDVSRFDTANVTDMWGMFEDCSNLKTIYASDKFTTASVTSDSAMFYRCTSLIGGAGTKYDSAHTDKEYARIDGGSSASGYFTRKS